MINSKTKINKFVLFFFLFANFLKRMKLLLINALALLCLILYGNNESNFPNVEPMDPFEAAVSLEIPANESKGKLTARENENGQDLPGENENHEIREDSLANRNPRLSLNHREKRSLVTRNIGIDCDNGSVRKEVRFDNCLVNKTCFSEDLMILKDLFQYGYALDILYTIKNDPGKYSMDMKNNIYRINCLKVNLAQIRDGKCYAENLVPVLVNGKKRFLGRSGFLINFAIEVPCKKRNTEEEIKMQISDSMASTYCLESIVLGLVHKINTRIDFSALFNSKSVESLMLIKESFTYNCHKNHLLIKFVLAWKKYSPFIFLVYSIVNYSHAISMCFYACFKRLPLKIAFSFIFRCLKHQKDLSKYIDQQEEHDNKKLRMTLRRSFLEQNMTDSEVQASHLTQLYETIIELNKRLKNLEKSPKSPQRSKLGKLIRRRETTV